MKYLFVAFIFMPLLLFGQTKSFHITKKDTMTVPTGRGLAVNYLYEGDSIFVYADETTDASAFICIVRGIKFSNVYYEAIDELGRPFMVGHLPIGFRPGVTLVFFPNVSKGINVATDSFK